ncbi:MAG: hypothetical protein Q7T11_06790 [Deltaproteobacteria bacterium]|nr:hypothetical protein [Deltaproteobacteria bacterium]
MKKTFLFLLLFPFPVFASTSLTGQISFENLNFLKNRAGHSINDQETSETLFRFVYDNQRSFKLDLEPRLKVDFLDSSRNRYLPNTAEIIFYSPTAEARGGIGLNPWGVSNSFNPTDVLNRKDLESNYYDPETLGDVFIKGKKSFTKAGPIADLSLTAFFFPLFQETPLPENDSRFALEGSSGGVPYSFLPDQDSPAFGDAWGGAFAIAGIIGRSDVSLHYYHGPEHLPGYVFVTDANGALRLQGFYYTLDMIGSNIEIPAGRFALHGEAAYKITSDERLHVLAFDDNNAVPNSYFQMVPGLDYTFQNVGRGEIELTTEYLREFKSGSDFTNFRAFQNDLFVGCQYRAGNRAETSAELGMIKDLTNTEMIWLARLESRLYKDIKGGLEGILVRRGNGTTPLSFFDNNSYVSAKLSWSFGLK